MPSLSDSTDYASMIVQAFKNYFVDKLAFKHQDRVLADIDIILVKTGNKLNYETKETGEDLKINRNFFPDVLIRQPQLINLFDTTAMYVCEVDNSIFSKLNIPLFSDYDNSSVLFLLDKDNNIVWRDDDYRGQGEHLKPLEYKIKDLLGLSYPKPENYSHELKVGDKAPEIILTEDTHGIRADSGDIQVLTYYPAAYSGVFDVDNMARRASMERLSMMSCAMHITSFDRMLPDNTGVRYYAISESTPEILDNWNRILGTHHIQYINDADYSIVQAFGAYNPAGYSNRMTVIIDGEGKIAYIDKDYKFEKDTEIQKIIKELQAKSK